MHKTIASAVCALAFMAGDLCAQSQHRYPKPLEVKGSVIIEPERSGTWSAQDVNSVYGYLECFSGGSKIECGNTMSDRQVAMDAGDILMLLQGMAKLLGTLQPRR